MALTLRAAVQAAHSHDTESIGQVALAVAHGALMGARGNSGVILSQYLRGLAQVLAEHHEADGATLARALSEGASVACRAIEHPVNGTMLTVASDVARVVSSLTGDHASPADVLEAAVTEAQASVERTRDLLPVLRQANVVDSGAMGLATIFEGMSRSIRGEALPSEDLAVPQQPAAVFVEPEAYGYCTEFLIHGTGIDVPGIRAKLNCLGDSVLVVGDPNTVRVHLHTFQPGEAIDFALSHGTVHQIKIENMAEQNRVLRTCGTTDTVTDTCGLVAVVTGRGMESVFQSLGTGVIVPGGQTLNPSTQDILVAVERCRSSECVVLPNNPNVVRTAQQVQSLTTKQLRIVPTRNMAEGVAAALAFQVGRTAEENAQAMQAAAASVRTAEITRAVRPTRLDGLDIPVDSVLGLIDDRIESVGTDVATVVTTVLSHLNAEACEVVTLYSGDEVTDAEGDSVSAHVRIAFPNQQVDLVSGGQPHYLYLLSCE